MSENPADFTPQVTSGKAVYKMLQVGSTMFAGGDFSVVSGQNRRNLFSFNASNGALTSLSVSFDGAVWALAEANGSLYVGGNFRTVNGVARRGLVKLDASTGAVDIRFNAGLRGNVSEADIVAGRLIIGGKFAKRLMAVNLATGADTGYINIPITGTVADNAGATDVYRFAVNPAGTRLVAVGNFTTVNGATRLRAFMLTLGTTSATLSPWYYEPLRKPCRATGIPAYLRDVDFSPDGSYFVIVSTGFVPRQGEVGETVCDATARFESGLTSPPRPTWMNYTGGDTLHSVAVTGPAVYVQGHQRWLDNPYGVNDAGPGAVERPGIGAIDPTSGKALAWNPGKTRGIGGKDLLITAQGLWVASDTDRIGGELHRKIALMPLS